MLRPATEAALAIVRERYLDIVHMRRTDWTHPRIQAAVAGLEFEAARLLEQQVRTYGEIVRGRFTNIPIKDLDGLKEALAETCRGIDTLTLAFACKKSRFYQSARVIEAIALAQDFLKRAREMTVNLTPFGMIPPRLEEDPRDIIEWLWRCGNALAPDTLSAYKKRFSPLRVQKHGPIRLTTDNPPFTALLAAAFFNEWRLAHLAREELAILLRNVLRPDGSIIGGRYPLDILFAAGIVRDAALYNHLTKGTVLALDPKMMQTLARSLFGFVAQTGYAGEPDALGISPLARLKYENVAQAFASIVWSAATLLLYDGAVDAASQTDMGALQAQYAAYLTELGYSEATAAMLELGHLAPRRHASPPRERAITMRYYPMAGYLVVNQTDFFGSVRLPFPEGSRQVTPTDAQLLGAMNILTETLNPNPLLLRKSPRWAWPGCTICEAVRTKSGFLTAEAIKQTSVLGGLVVEKGAMAAANITAEGTNARLLANRSWFIFEDKAVALGSKIAASTTDIANPGWLAAPKDRFPWFLIELPQPTMVNAVRIYYRVKGGVYVCVPREIIIQVSVDGQQFRDVRSITKFPAAGTKPEGYTTAKFMPALARYIRFFFPEGADGETVGLSDVQVYYFDRPEDIRRLGKEIPNLASLKRGAKATASSSADNDNTPDKVLSGSGEPGTTPLSARTCVFILSAKAANLMVNDGITRPIRLPEKDKETKIAQVRWINVGGLGCLFAPPADLIVRNEGDEECIVYIDHSRSDSFGVVYLPNQNPDETARAAEAEWIEVKSEKDVHHVHDKASGLRGLVVFAPQDKGDVITPGTGCAFYKVEGVKLSCTVQPRLLREGLAIRLPGIQEVWVDGHQMHASVQGDLIAIGGQ